MKSVLQPDALNFTPDQTRSKVSNYIVNSITWQAISRNVCAQNQIKF